MGQKPPPDNMPIEVKIKEMKKTWDNLAKHADKVPPPDWHKDVLENRERALKEGVEESIDWNVAKKLLKKDIE